MFERYDESARRALFFARYEVAQLGGVTIEPEHLVLGILRESPQAILRFATPGPAADGIHDALAKPIGDKVSTSVEIPFSGDCKAVLQHTAIEADELGNGAIVLEHMVLGILVKTSGAAARVLHDAGARIDAVRAHLKTQVHSQPAEYPRSPLVSRHWTGIARPGQEDAYVAHLERETFPALRRLDGFVGASIHRRPVEGWTEFQIITIWRSLDDIKAFAGADVEAAVVPPAAAALLLSYDRRAVHYNIVTSTGTLR
jgi:Antibiotic biosynthesis monooxygenase/Clp amino terminal domain, pathogenicity island component